MAEKIKGWYDLKPTELLEAISNIHKRDVYKIVGFDGLELRITRLLEEGAITDSQAERAISRLRELSQAKPG